MKLPARVWKPLCFLLLLAVPVAAIAFASRGVTSPSTPPSTPPSAAHAAR